MRFLSVAAVAACAAIGLRAEIHDVLKSSEIDTRMAKVAGTEIVHQRPNFTIALNAPNGAGAAETHDDADEVLFIRKGKGAVTLDGTRHEVGPGDVVHIHQKMPHKIDPASGRLEFVSVRITPAGPGATRPGARPSPRIMPAVLPASEIAALLTNFDKNQPIHGGANFTMNTVIYPGRSGPWEAHEGCVDIYFLQSGTATAELGGKILEAKLEAPGEIRGTGVSGARRHGIGPGDIVVIPRNTAHHMDPGAGRLTYLLMKVWVE
jgi:mannose-6-phosphate isomerase-like protein (cupin superfamily)